MQRIVLVENQKNLFDKATARIAVLICIPNSNNQIIV